MKKRIFYFTVIIVILQFTLKSCKKEESLETLIIGKWDVESVTQVNFENGVKVSSYTIYVTGDEMSVQFIDGGSGMIYQDGGLVGSFSWTLNGNTISISGGSEVLTWTIILENDILTWSFSESEVVDNVTMKYEYFYSAGRSEV